jgi:hypothetical protein
MSNQGTIRLKVTNGAPAIEKLWNGRFKLEFLCDNNSPKEDWYYDNISSILPDYGILQETNFGSGVSEDWEAIPSSVYPDMRLVETEYLYIPAMGDKRVKLTYETLTASWVEEKSEDTDYELNGLERVSRTFVALPGTTYDKVVGTNTINGDGTTLYLGSFKIEKTEAKWELTEVWLEAGTLSETLDNVGSQKAKVIETIGADPATPSGYSLASKQESDFEGFQTNRFTFLKNNVVLSESADKVGSQLAIVKEVFNGTPTNPSGYSIANTQESDVGGIPTRRFTFLKNNVVLSESEDKVGSQLAIVKEVFNGTPTTPAGYLLANAQKSDVGGIPTRRYTFLKPSILSTSTDNVGSQKATVIETFSQTPGTPAGYLLASNQVSDLGGIKTNRYTFLKHNVELSRSEDKVGSQLAIVTQVFRPTNNPTKEGYSLASTEESDVDGIPTKRFTFLKEDVELFHSEDLEGGLNEIVEEWFNPDPTNERDIKDGYVLIDKTESDVSGIPTERYTFWKEKGLIDESYVNEAEGVIRTTQVFFSEVDDTKVIGPVVSKDTKNIDGIPTITVQTLQGKKGVSITGEYERLANQYEQLVSFTYPGLVSIQTNPVGPLYTSYAWRLSPPVQCVVKATTFVFFQDSNQILPADYLYSGASGHWNPTEWAKGESYGIGYGYSPFSESKGFRGYRADPQSIEVTENAPNNYLINGNRLYEDTTGGLNIYGGPEDPSTERYVLDVKITPAFVDVDGKTSYKKVIVVATIPQQEDTPVPPPTPIIPPEEEEEEP